MGLLNFIGGVISDTVQATVQGNRVDQQADEAFARAQEEGKAHAEQYQYVMEQEKNAYPKWKEYYIITYMFSKVMRNDWGQRDFSQFDQLPDEYRESDLFKQNVQAVEDQYYSTIAPAIKSLKMTVPTACLVLQELKTLQEASEDAERLSKAFNVLQATPVASKSVLTDCDDITEKLEKIRNIDLQELFKPVNDFGEGFEPLEAGKYKESLEHLLLPNYEQKDFDLIKEGLLHFALDPEQDCAVTEMYEGFKVMCLRIFGIPDFNGPEDDEYVVLYPCVDMVIAEVIRHKNSGSTEKYRNTLREWLKNCGEKIDLDQLNVMQNVFSVLQAFDLEKEVLEYMVSINYPRTSEQDKRLKFLQGGSSIGNASSETTGYEVINVTAEEDQLLYDHRFLNWKSNDIKKYFDNLMLLQKTQTFSVVLDEWKKDVELQNVKWDNCAVQKIIQDGLKKEFGEDYTVTIVNSGAALDGWIDVLPSIYVQAADPNMRYSEISYVVSGEQITHTRIRVSIMVLMSSLDTTNKPLENDVLCKKILSVKEKHNPRLDTVIETMKTLLVTQIELWINQNNFDTNIY